MSGHKVADCDGDWIDISTLASPRQEMCLKCRGVRLAAVGEDPPSPWPPPPALYPEPTEEAVAQRSGVGLWGCLGLGLVAFLVGFTAGWLVG